MEIDSTLLHKLLDYYRLLVRSKILTQILPPPPILYNFHSQPDWQDLSWTHRKWAVKEWQVEKLFGQYEEKAHKVTLLLTGL